MLISASDLRKSYLQDDVETRALNGVSLQLDSSDFLAIIGASGSGKSTLLHLLGLLDRPTEGSYLLNGVDTASYTDQQLAIIRNQQLGFIFQTFNLLPKLSVLENVKLPLLYSNKPERHWNDLALKQIVAVGLEQRAKHLANQLSGGEKQRVAIARALVNQPKIVFADEPTGNLDSGSGKTVMSVLQSLNEKQGHTIVLVTHETYTAQHADRIIELKDGQIVSDHAVKQRRKASSEFIK